ncbi:SIS domain protein [Leptospira inadai serovar Lyme str. 10]|uniref:SIS domain protein n=2 Tax=Leptospira inadai serovar Lyme TaxID=293084 RepID=V6HV28_9LEPT|nr:SIS domain-containing protein [Leptospira inadai]EQA36669.1 SIS domain protein [Leptospira inadai serovar Lyme str. 10]PNV76490.1 phosphoheptose isomerase [Leptospira inadai serovar Lyme]
MKDMILSYTSRLGKVFTPENISAIEMLAETLWDAWKTKKTVYICGNGGSAGNAIHLANDFNYGIDKGRGIGLRIEALPANSSVITCIANDEGYEFIFSQQLEVKANEKDILIVLSGSGNSPNILKALEIGNRLAMKTFAVLGYTGGKAKSIAQYPIHFEIDDMQISEDLQLIVGHILMQWMYKKGQESK